MVRKLILHYFGSEIPKLVKDKKTKLWTKQHYTIPRAQLLLAKIKVLKQKKNYNFFDFNSFIDVLKIIGKPDENNAVLVWNLKIFLSFLEDEYYSKLQYFNGVSFEETRNGDTGIVYGACLKIKEGGKLWQFDFFDLQKWYPVSLTQIGVAFNINVTGLNMLEMHREADELAPWELKAFDDQFNLIEQLAIYHFKQHPRQRLKLTRSSYVFSNLRNKIKGEDKALHHGYSTCIFGTDDKPLFKDKKIYDTLRHAYYGGFNYLNEKYKGKLLGAGLDIDINSMYPYVMAAYDFPIQNSIYKINKKMFSKLSMDDLIKPNMFAVFHLYIDKLQLKPGCYPTLPKKSSFIQNKAIRNFNDLNSGELYLSNYDFYHLLKNYNIQYRFISGVSWHRLMVKPFKNYVDFNFKCKQQAKLNHDELNYLINKFNLNMSYGKFGQSPLFKKALPYFNEQTNMTEFDSKITDNGYLRNITLAIFITSIARHLLFESIDKVNSNCHCTYLYSDTDSIHFLIDNEYSKLSSEQILYNIGIDHDETALGKFKVERRFKHAKFIRNKGYAEQLDDSAISVVVSGLGQDGRQVISDQIALNGWEWLTLDEPLLVPTKMAVRVQGGTLIRPQLVTINKNDISLKEMI